MSEEEKKLYMKYCKYDEEPKKNILNLIEIIEKQQKGNEELKEIEAEYKKTNSELFKNNVELRIENERLKHERIRYIGRNLNNNIKQKQKELKEKYDKDIHTLQNQLDIANADKINNYISKAKIEKMYIEMEQEYKRKVYDNNYNRTEVKKEEMYKRQVYEKLLESEE